jgi:hypothetical protein
METTTKSKFSSVKFDMHSDKAKKALTTNQKEGYGKHE